MQDKSPNMRVANECFEIVAKLIYLEMAVTNQNNVCKKVKSKLYIGSLCCTASVQDLVSLYVLSRYLRIKIYKTLNFICCFI